MFLLSRPCCEMGIWSFSRNSHSFYLFSCMLASLLFCRVLLVWTVMGWWQSPLDRICLFDLEKELIKEPANLTEGVVPPVWDLALVSR